MEAIHMGAIHVEAIQYHAQRQAQAFAAQVIPVPPDFPVHAGFPDGLRQSFARLRDWGKRIYLDMAERPEAYGLMLLDIAETDHNLARDSYRAIQRFADTLYALAISGEVSDHKLAVNAAAFRDAIKRKPGVPKYGAILARLNERGLRISNLRGEALERGAETFIVECPDDPEMIDAVKAYCTCWTEVDRFRHKDNPARHDLIKMSPQEFHHHFYRFDYKIVSDLAVIPVLTWVRDEGEYSAFDDALKRFNEAFYQASLEYEGLRFDGEYHYKGKRIARITPKDYSALGDPKYALSLKLKDMDKYGDYLQTLPDTILEPMTHSSCRDCGFQGATAEKCKFRVLWTLNGVAHRGCAFWCFFFEDYRPESVPLYWDLLAREYGLKKNAVQP